MREVTNEAFEAAYSDINNRRVISKVCRQFHKQVPRDELMYRGDIALFTCLRKHNPDSGNKFTTSLHRHTKWQCLKALRQQNKYKDIHPLPVDEVDPRQSFIDRLCVRDCIEQLPSHDAKIIRQHFFERKTLREIGTENGYSHIAAWQKLEKAKLAFRRKYEGDEFGV